jgi:hypothetical protein
MLPAVLLLKAAAKRFTNINLEGGIVIDAYDFPTVVSTLWQIDQDGKVYLADTFSGLVVQDEDTDWIIPHTAAPGPYQVRYTALTGDSPTTETAAEDVWYALSSGDFTLILTQDGVGSKSNSFTFEIRSGTGPVLASNVYTMSSTVNI